MYSITRDSDLPISAESRESIDRMMVRYCSAIDNGEFEIWPTLFTEDGEYRLTTRTDFEAGRTFGVWYCSNRAMLEDRVTAIRGVSIYEPHTYRHVISPTEIVGIEGNLVKCETSYIVIRTDVDGEMTVFSSGRYVDDILLEDGKASIRSRVVVADSARFDTLVALPV